MKEQLDRYHELMTEARIIRQKQKAMQEGLADLEAALVGIGDERRALEGEIAGLLTGPVLRTHEGVTYLYQLSPVGAIGASPLIVQKVTEVEDSDEEE